jgi:NADP-dependent 3-hydroxy acid dehydrogenase YdfG
MSKIVPHHRASSGFGRLTAEALARDGHAIFASMRDIIECITGSPVPALQGP